MANNTEMEAKWAGDILDAAGIPTETYEGQAGGDPADGPNVQWNLAGRVDALTRREEQLANWLARALDEGDRLPIGARVAAADCLANWKAARKPTEGAQDAEA